jgi:hypothetical protein
MTTKKMYEFAHIHQPALFADQDLAEGLGKNIDRLESIFLSARSNDRYTPESSRSPDMMLTGCL